MALTRAAKIVLVVVVLVIIIVAVAVPVILTGDTQDNHADKENITREIFMNTEDDSRNISAKYGTGWKNKFKVELKSKNVFNIVYQYIIRVFTKSE